MPLTAIEERSTCIHVDPYEASACAAMKMLPPAFTRQRKEMLLANKCKYMLEGED